MDTLLGHPRRVVQPSSGLKYRLRKLWQKVFPILSWGCMAWALKQDSGRIADGMLIIVRGLMMHNRKLP